VSDLCRLSLHKKIGSVENTVNIATNDRTAREQRTEARGAIAAVSVVACAYESSFAVRARCVLVARTVRALVNVCRNKCTKVLETSG